ncbi:TraV family lipoprotein [Novosphingobium album (ex Liu et al. 2023)]|uniref:TraV family lipoprotein n=1 Tax=Novosphingobium album (ex Liu et al. 2023) TaxID=3031130 RepID=A0ABT5WS26_9SPHN|nr:TraV family lipoprotein [Novosphingobium album (ex Liu et al. 2023)]MDE8652851.1 TraV family lipoprotein [Novosphingobium album (ex Liu et al. 2023)]
MSARDIRRRWLTASVGMASLASLAGCASFGGNVKGSFSCAAPDGICAPSSNIDDRALAMISGDASEGDALPAGGFDQRSSGRGHRASAGQPARLAASDPARTREKVLRIVFQPYIDERGRLHEASAVHAVVASGEWQQAILQSVPMAGRSSAAQFDRSESLADAVDRADPPGGLAAIDLGLPDPAAVAAARARGADPVGAIKADVAARLAPKQRTASAPAMGSTASVPPPSSALAESSAAPPVPASGGAPVKEVPAQMQGPVSAAGATAVDRVKADPAYQGVAGSVAKGAREAAAQTGAEPAPAKGGTVKAASFPAAVSEDN